MTYVLYVLISKKLIDQQKYVVPPSVDCTLKFYKFYITIAARTILKNPQTFRY